MPHASRVPSTSRAGGRFDFALLVGLTVLFFAPYFRPTMFPVLDAASLMQQFHYFYSGFYFGQGIPAWYPYGNYGVQSDILRLGYLSPSSYLVGLVGAVCRVGDVLLLFKISLLLEYLTLLTGIYLLAGVLFADRATRMLVSIGAVGSTIWYAQPFFNFRIYYLLPLVLFLLARFLDTRRMAWLACAALAGFAWLLGAPPYYAPLWVFSIAIASVVLLREWLAALRDIPRQPAWTVATVLLLALLAGAYAYAAGQSTENLTMSAAGRNAASGQTDLTTFLTYGGLLDKRAVARTLVVGLPTHLENGSGRDVSLYCGLPIAFFFLAAFVLVREAWFAAICTMMLSLVLLSFGGGFARLAYLFPGMSYYRHIAHVYGLVKILLIVCAGFGMERCWRAAPRVQIVAAALAALLLLAVSVAVGSPAMTGRVAVYCVAALVCSWMTDRRIGLSPAGLKAGLIVGLVIDLASFQATVFAEVPPTVTAGQEQLLQSTRVRALRWQGARSSEPENTESRVAWSLATRPEGLVTYAFAYNFAGFDPCTSQVRSDLMSAGMARLVGQLPPGSARWNEAMGCGEPKLRVVRAAASVAGGRVDFAESVAVAVSAAVPVAVAAAAPVVTAFSANRIAVDVDVPGGGDAWLVYADAYHPGWTAQVNGAPTKIYAAFDAGKAVRLSPGRNAVSFVFRRPLADALAYAFALYGAVFSLAVLWGSGRVVVGELRPR